jgi:His-Xaa-Ser system radical SAM maturase HxsC
MHLQGRVVPKGQVGPIPTDVWRIRASSEDDARLPLATLTDAVETGRRSLMLPTATLELPERLYHLAAGDIVGVTPDGSAVTVLWKASARHNSLLLTEQCDNYCVMCSQPPKQRDDSWLFERAERVVSLLSAGTGQVGLTGGEPTLHEDHLLRLIGTLRDRLPSAQVHLLSNGRRFANPAFARRYANLSHPGLMVGIPLYAPEPSLHDWVVQAEGAFDETVRGVLALGGLGQRIELRVVVQAANVPVLPQLAEFIARNLPFVEQVALMGLEMTGLARANHADVWIDPIDYQTELVEAARVLTTAQVRTLVFNHPLCVLDRRLHHLAVASISEWKADHATACRTCELIDDCGGVFATSGRRISRALHPVHVTAGRPEPSVSAVT